MNQEDDSKAKRPDQSIHSVSNNDGSVIQPRIATSKLVPTEESLAFSERIAKELDLPFDREQTAAHSQELSTRYFKDIVSVIAEFTKGITLEQGSTNSLEAFIEPYQSEGWVFIDDHLDIWLFSLNKLVLFKACYHTTDEEEAQLSEWVKRYLSISMTEDPHQNNLVLREETRKLFINYANLLPVANAMSVSMMIFIICHEISHHYLGHLNQAASPSSELEADKLAYELFLKVAEHKDRLKSAQIDESTTSAPALMMVYLRGLSLKTLGADIGTTQHPPASERLAALIEMGKTTWSDTSRERFTELKLQFEKLSLGE